MFWEDTILEFIEGLKNNTTLIYLDVVNSNLSSFDTGLVLEALENNKTLKTLRLNTDDNESWPTDIPDDYCKKLANLIEKNQVLRVFDFNPWACEDVGYCKQNCSNVLWALKKNSTLEDIDLQGFNIGKSLINDLFEVLKNNTTLKKLDLRRNHLDDECLKKISGALAENSSLTELWIAENDFSEKGAKEFLEIFKCKSSLHIRLK